ncbi:SDR family NAD(P)-dependent oxidoreductase [Cypionkella sp.]|uniref:SDR family NAD(P)-dependent oxidoreductase n=1 Tax=Cypionkella sp. TaxID=2811411 RepID=UPI002618FB81|nr:SDR family oxidoreductase [Cypionkella sp.]MDB5665413.1 short-chain dehydrogenase/reductase [Cypionkella sp.]
MLLQDRIAFVTAAGAGIGRAGALAMAAEGARLIVTDLDSDSASETAALIISSGGIAEAMRLDVTDDAALTRAINDTASRYGKLDILHSHAGIQIPGKLDQITPADMDNSWRLNVRAHFVAAQAAIAIMKLQRSGSIIITASNSGVQYDREMIAYTTTKHAVIAMTKQIAVDYARYNIRCNALCPGFVDTTFNAGFEAQMGGRLALEDYVATLIPMRRFGRVDEISDSIVFLASDKSSFMTGHALVIDGAESL